MGCYNKVPQTGGLIQQILISQFWRGEESKIKVPADLFPGEDPLPGLRRAAFLLCPPMVEGEGFDFFFF